MEKEPIKVKGNDTMLNGPFQGMLFKEIALSQPEYFTAIVQYLPSIYFSRIELCFLLIQGNFELDDAFQMYNKNILKPVHHELEKKNLPSQKN